MADTSAVEPRTVEDLMSHSVGKGRIIRIIGPVIDVKFDGTVAAIDNALTVDAKDTPIGEVRTILEVESQLPGGVVRTVASKRVYSPNALLPAEKDVEPVVCRFAAEAIPDCGEVHFVVRPVGEWGKFGEPLATDWTPVAYALRSCAVDAEKPVRKQ